MFTMIDSACLHPLLADRLSRVGLDMRKKFIFLGDLASIVSVLPSEKESTCIPYVITCA
jgi:hypothetical protein